MQNASAESRWWASRAYVLTAVTPMVCAGGSAWDVQDAREPPETAYLTTIDERVSESEMISGLLKTRRRGERALTHKMIAGQGDDVLPVIPAHAP